jgi:hypothetical protein
VTMEFFETCNGINKRQVIQGSWILAAFFAQYNYEAMLMMSPRWYVDLVSARGFASRNIIYSSLMYTSMLEIDLLQGF